jgi:hypothetical protein
VRDLPDRKDDRAFGQDLCAGQDVAGMGWERDISEPGRGLREGAEEAVVGGCGRLERDDPRGGEEAPGAPGGQVWRGLDAAVGEAVVAATSEGAVKSRHRTLRKTKGRTREGVEEAAVAGVVSGGLPGPGRAEWGVAAKTVSIAWAKGATERRR